MIRVLIVDDDALVRLGLGLVLGAGEDIEVVGEAEDGASALALAGALHPDVVLIDLRMPGMDGLSATEALRGQAGRAGGDAPAVLVLTTFDTGDNVLRALRAGAVGFLVKDTPPLEILQAVRRAAAGESSLSPTAIATLIGHVVAEDDEAQELRRAAAQRAQTALAGLTQRERDVALAVAEGLSNQEIAERLYLSVATVKSHVSRLLETLGCSNRVQIAILVHEAGG